MVESFNMKEFVFSWEKNEELKKIFWNLFGFIIIANIALVILNAIRLFVFLGKTPLSLMSDLIYYLIYWLIPIYVLYKFLLNEITFRALSQLGYKPGKVGFLETIVAVIGFMFAIILPIWSPILAGIQIILIGIIFANILNFIYLESIFLPLIGITLISIHNILRLYLFYPIYLVKKGEQQKVDLIKVMEESWRMTDKRIIKLIVYTLKGIWYVILKTWLYILGLIFLLILVFSSFASGGLSSPSLGIIFLTLLGIFLIGILITLYLHVVSLFVYNFLSSGVYYLFDKKIE
ncbi:MAG: hypothetical protein NZ903_02405 [Candidatus Micrarchaeota archaeon]|nr:hypothetical protein [Candidatus Micrarchaeota archaeon]